jgi:hypothetical protein
MAFRAVSSAVTGANGTTSLTLPSPTLPAAPQVGDRLIIAVRINMVGTAADSVISGLTGMNPQGAVVDDDVTTGREKLAIYTRVIDGTEPASTVITATNVQGRMAAIAYVESACTIGQVLVSKYTGAATLTRAMPSITTTSSAKLLFFAGDAGLGGATTTLTSADTKRAELYTSNLSHAAFDTGDTPLAAGTYNRTATSDFSTALFNRAIVELNPTGTPPVTNPDLTLTLVGPLYVIDSNGVAPSGQTITGYSLAQLSGPTTTPVTLNSSAGVFGVPFADTLTTWRVTATASGGGTQTSDYSVEPLQANGLADILELTDTGWVTF